MLQSLIHWMKQSNIAPKTRKGMIRYATMITAGKGRSNNFHYEVYDGVKEILDEDGDVVDFKDPVYMTKQYYL